MAKKITARTYQVMDAKELFIVLSRASAREDFAESDRIVAAAPKRTYIGIDREVVQLNLRAMQLAQFFLFGLQAAAGVVRATKYANQVLCLAQGKVPFGVGEDEAAMAGVLERKELGDDNPVFTLWGVKILEARDAAAQEVSAMLDALAILCEEDIGLTPEQLIASTIPNGVAEYEAAVEVRDLDPDPKRVEQHLELYRMLWTGKEPPSVAGK